MSAAIKTPGVYTAEMPAFPSSVVEVETAIPAFLGYTEKAEIEGKPLTDVPWRISSMAEYESCFGGPQKAVFRVHKINPETTAQPSEVFSIGTDRYTVTPAANVEQRFLLHASMRLFFGNGGGPCYIVSVGSYGDAPVTPDALRKGIDLLEKEQEPTILVVPDAVHLPTEADCIGIQQHALCIAGRCRTASPFWISTTAFAASETRPAIPSPRSVHIWAAIT